MSLTQVSMYSTGRPASIDISKRFLDVRSRAFADLRGVLCSRPVGAFWPYSAKVSTLMLTKDSEGYDFQQSNHSRRRGGYREKPIKAIEAALISDAHAQPRTFIVGELTRFPMTLRSLVRSTTMITSGGAKRPLRMADQNGIFTALKPAKSNARPTKMETLLPHRVGFC